MNTPTTFVCIGTGNVAHHLCKALVEKDYMPLQVVSRTLEEALTFQQKFSFSSATHKLNQLDTNADFYIIAVNDDAIHSVIRQMPRLEHLVFHTSGSTGLSVFEGKFAHCGVFYPLQSFSVPKNLDFYEVPVFLEWNDNHSRIRLHAIASDLSGKIYEADSAQRRRLHIAAVFACNFTNHMVSIAEDLMEEDDLPFDLLKPLLDETFSKVKNNSPLQMQTGPASRNDVRLIQIHIDALKDRPDLQKIYTFVSKSIIRYNQKRKNF